MVDDALALDYNEDEPSCWRLTRKGTEWRNATHVDQEYDDVNIDETDQYDLCTCKKQQQNFPERVYKWTNLHTDEFTGFRR